MFRAERDTQPAAPRRAAYRVTDLELASRLSFFLWSSIPDDELLSVAAQGRLSGAGRARAAGQADAGRLRAPSALVSNFAGQWLYLRNLRNVRPEQGRVPRLRRQPAAGDAA